MAKLTIDDLKKIKERVEKTTTLRVGGKYRAKVNVHMGTCGIASGARKILQTIMKLMEERGITDVMVTTSGCAGMCVHEPMMTVELPNQPPVKYIDLTEEKTKEIFEKHILGGEIVEKYVLGMGPEKSY
ncbi:MAG TPA: (2Fe-2S) ferredoxin domain-containing protein [Proteobacteria bacterium]|nr:(2Fe-2S) ferredoxin domain-containing protein [Pseudomonadota bacterium]